MNNTRLCTLVPSQQDDKKSDTDNLRIIHQDYSTLTLKATNMKRLDSQLLRAAGLCAAHSCAGVKI